MKKHILNYSGLICFFLTTSSLIQAQLNVNYTINTTQGRAAISPYIYGTNGSLAGGENFSAFRVGGNRLTGYNWENNYSNAGSDWQHSSDTYLVGGLTGAEQATPGIIALKMVDNNPGKYTIFTLPMAGYVSKDKNGTVATGEAAPSSRWVQVVNKKGSAFTLTPNTSDNSIYVDEFLNYVVNKKGNAASGGINAYLLDNEPDLWFDTHPRIFNQSVGCAQLLTKSISLAKVVKDMDNTALVFGFESYGFNGFTSLQDAPDWNAVKAGYSWFIDYYLDKMKVASNTDGRRLLDVLSLHWYPEAKGDNRITNSNATTSNDNIARMQAPRSLWDSSYTENSWIAQCCSNKLPLLPEVMKSVNTYYPGTKLAFTEYNYGDFNHVSSGIAQADVLGIFGKYGVHSAYYWNMQSNVNYTSAGFKIFRNYDGNKSTFGNTKVTASMSDKVNSSVYASIVDQDENVLTMIVINKHLTQSINGAFAINSGAAYSNASVWGFDSQSAVITQRSSVNTITGNNFNYTIPPLSVLMFKIQTISTGVAQSLAADNHFSVYPNPSAELLTVSGENVSGEIIIKIYDALGKMLNTNRYVSQGTFTNEINISSLSGGIYYISIEDGNNAVKQFRFVKK